MVTADRAQQLKERANRHYLNYRHWLDHAKVERQIDEAYEQYIASLNEYRAAQAAIGVAP